MPLCRECENRGPGCLRPAHAAGYRIPLQLANHVFWLGFARCYDGLPGRLRDHRHDNDKYDLLQPWPKRASRTHRCVVRNDQSKPLAVMPP